MIEHAIEKVEWDGGIYVINGWIINKESQMLSFFINDVFQPSVLLHSKSSDLKECTSNDVDVKVYFNIKYKCNKVKDLDVMISTSNNTTNTFVNRKNILLNPSLMYHIDEIVVSRNLLTIKGWFLSFLGSNACVKLIDVKDSTLEVYSRDDVISHFPAYDFTSIHNCGFSICVPLTKIILKKHLRLEFSDGKTALYHSINRSDILKLYYQKAYQTIHNKIHTNHRTPINEHYSELTNELTKNIKDYQNWLMSSSPTFAELKAQREHSHRYNPLISIIVPMFNTNVDFAIAMVDSVRSQTYFNWELCIVDAGSDNSELIRTLLSFTEDKKIKVQLLGENYGISKNSNLAIEMCTGEFVMMLDHDDLLTENALFEFVKLLNVDSTLDAVYSDQDKIDDNGIPFEPFFKPDWSPEYLRGVMYVGHLLMVRMSLMRKINGFDSNYDFVQDYELMLRISENTNRVAHISKVLYHWRCSQGSLALDVDAKPLVDIKQCDAVNAHLKRLNLHAVAERGVGRHRLMITPILEYPNVMVSIIIPSKNAPEHISRCLHSIFSVTTHLNFEVIVVDNGTTDKVALEVLNKYPVKVVQFNETFNFSKANNIGVANAQGEILVFLNNDTEILTPRWLQNFIYYLKQDSVGAVGPLMLFPNMQVQHAGIVLGMRGSADHVMRGFPCDVDGYAGSLSCAREVSGVTAACLATKKELFLDVGGFNEHYFTHYQDVDLCLKIVEKDQKIICTPRVTLIHYESVTRSSYYDYVDRVLLLDKWWHLIDSGDQYYNTNLDVSLGDYSIKGAK